MLSTALSFAALLGLAIASPIPAPQLGNIPSFGGGGAGLPAFGGAAGGIPSFPGLGGAGGLPALGSGGGKLAALGGGGGGLTALGGLGGGGGGLAALGGFGSGGGGLAALGGGAGLPSFPSLGARQSGGCSSYTIIDTRGTGERQGPSSGFRTMNRAILAANPGGSVRATVYPASFSQNSASGTADILRTISSGLAQNPSQCFILEGYSQGAAATVNAMAQIPASDPRFDAVKGVFLIGNPEHKAGLACNVDTNGGTTTDNVNGISAAGRNTGVPAEWVSKTLDVCNRGDGVCDTTNGFGINAAHLAYPNNAGTQRQGTDFVSAALSA